MLIWKVVVICHINGLEVRSEIFTKNPEFPGGGPIATCIYNVS